MSRFVIFIVLIFLVIGGYFFWPRSTKGRSQWTVQIQKNRPRSKNTYDVIIVGGGMGGLSCGSLLAKKGYKVLVLEKNPEVGGFCSQHQENGFIFSYGTEDINGIWERGAVSYLLRTLKFDEQRFFVANSRRFYVGDEWFDVGAEEGAFERALKKKFPTEERSIERFFTDSKKVYMQAYDPEMIKNWGIIVPGEFIEQAMPEEWRGQYETEHAEFIAWKKKSYQEVLDEYFENSKIKKVLSGLVGYFGTRPVKISASEAIINIFGYFFFGGFHALRTPSFFADNISKYIQSRGGSVLCNSYVDTIKVENGVVVGVQAGDQEFYAPIVVSNVNAKTTYFDLMESKNLSQDFLRDLRELAMGRSAFILYLGVDGSLEEYPELIQDRYNQVYISIISKNDSFLAPKGKSAVIVRETARYLDFIGKSPEQLEKYVQKRMENLSKKASQLIPELQDKVVMRHIATPKEFEELVGIPQGSIFGFATSNVKSWPYFKSPIRGLYLVGVSSGGPGISNVVTSGILCAHDINGWQEASQAPQ